MKKINLFLWGIVSTCITFFYRTEIYGADYSYSVAKNEISSCAGYDEDVFDAENKLKASVTTKSLCHAGAIFIGCSTFVGNEIRIYELSKYGIDALASYCLQDNYGGTCRAKGICPDPGEWQATTKDTFIYLDTKIVVCSAHYIDILEDGMLTYKQQRKPNSNEFKLYVQSLYLIQPRDRSAFGHVNSLSNTCAINTEDSIEDDTGWYSYTEKCYYTE